jgi:hypothetical protein
MFNKKVSEKVTLRRLIISLVCFVVVILGILLVLFFMHPIGSGLPPPKVMPGWYIPDASKGKEHACTLPFSKVSPYCDMVNVSGEKFMVVWYFDDESDFFKGEDALYRYLNENGNVFQQKLNISTELQEKIKRDEANNSWSPTFGSHSFNATGYKSPEMSGYFLVYERPFLETREDYFIVYYGITGSTNLTEETSALKEFIAETYYMANEEGKVDGLMVGDRKKKGNSLFRWF